MRVYVAGPYTRGDVAENVANAIHVGEVVADCGHIPFIPHLSHFWHMQHQREYEWWMEWAITWLRSCDVVIRLPGESLGADREVRIAKQSGRPVLGLVSLLGPLPLIIGNFLRSVENEG